MQNYHSAEEAFNRIQTKVRKVGGENAPEFQANAENIRDGNLDDDQQILVFSALKSLDPRFAVFSLPTSEKNGPGFNTTSHLIEMARLLIDGRLDTAILYLNKVADFTRQIINEKIEEEFREEIHVLIGIEFMRMMTILEEASENVDKIQILGKDYIYKGKDKKYTSFTGFGEILCQKIYSSYLKMKGLKVGELDSEDNINRIFQDDPAEAMKNEIMKINQLRMSFSVQLQEVIAEKPDVIITGGWEALIATMRNYSDKKAALIAQVLKGLGYEVLNINEKKDPMRSADPGVLGPDNGSKPIERMHYGFLKELTGSRGADTTVLHSDVAEMLESYNIPTVIMNPFGKSTEGTLITRDYLPEKDGAELIASKSIKAALTIKSGNMPDQEGVMATISSYFEKLSIDTVQTTNNTVFITFDGDVSKEQCRQLQRILDQKFAAKYKLELRKDLAFVFCLGNNMNAIFENAKGTLALKESNINPLRVHAVDEESVVSFLLEESDRINAVRVLHKTLISGRGK